MLCLQIFIWWKHYCPPSFVTHAFNFVKFNEIHHIVSGNASPHTIRSIISKGTQLDNDIIAFKKVCRCQTMKGHVTTCLIVNWSDMWNITWKSFLGDYDFSTRLNFVCNLKINLIILYSFKNNVSCYPLIFLLTIMLRSFLLYSNRIWRIGSV